MPDLNAIQSKKHISDASVTNMLKVPNSREITDTMTFHFAQTLYQLINLCFSSARLLRKVDLICKTKWFYADIYYKFSVAYYKFCFLTNYILSRFIAAVLLLCLKYVE